MNEKPEITILGEGDIHFPDPGNSASFIESLNKLSPNTVVEMTVSQLLRVLNNLGIETQKSEFSREQFTESIPKIPERFSKTFHTYFLRVFHDGAQVMRENGTFEAVFWNILLLSKQDLRSICLQTKRVGSKSKLGEGFCDMFEQILKESGHVFPKKSLIRASYQTQSYIRRTQQYEMKVYDLYEFFDHYCNIERDKKD